MEDTVVALLFSSINFVGLVTGIPTKGLGIDTLITSPEHVYLDLKWTRENIDTNNGPKIVAACGLSHVGEYDHNCYFDQILFAIRRFSNEGP